MADTLNEQAPEPSGRGPSVFDLKLADLRAADPLRWLAAGWRDFIRCPRIGLFYGLCFAAMGVLTVVMRSSNSDSDSTPKPMGVICPV